MTATLGNSESSIRPGRRWWRYFGVGTIVALVLYAAFILNRGNNKPTSLASGVPRHSEELTADFENLESQISNLKYRPRPPRRRAAEYVLSIGGTIKESGQEREIDAVADLPNGAFELTVVNLNGNPKVTDAGLAHFKDWKNVMRLSLSGTQVTDAGLVLFRDCKDLFELRLGTTQISDACLPDLANMSKLTELNRGNTRISLHGHEQLKAAMPRVGITWSEPNRTVAENVLQTALPQCQIQWDEKP